MRSCLINGTDFGCKGDIPAVFDAAIMPHELADLWIMWFQQNLVRNEDQEWLICQLSLPYVAEH